ncbi:tRNA pseudouridine(55) synthase [Gammaproteobacteria bacterium]
MKGQRRGTHRRGRDVNGVLLLDKPQGLTSNAALQEVKALFFAKKAGHTGSLDPLATGLLPLCFGEATKISAFLLDADKHYQVRVRLGVTTTTGDAEGEITTTHDASGVTATAIEQALAGFRGDIEQLPPMYSAIKHQGQRLYHLARQGIEVERSLRTVRIYQLTLQGLDLPKSFDLDILCSKGTYVRTLVEDIGKTLGCGGHVEALRRIGVGSYTDQSSVTLNRIEQLAQEDPAALDDLLLPMDSGLTHWPEVRLGTELTFYIKQGQPVLVPRTAVTGWVRMYSSVDDSFLGIGEILDDGRVAPRRLVV